MPDQFPRPAIARRRFIGGALAGLAALKAAPVAAAPVGRLAMHNLHTDERLEVVYRQGREYDRRALARLDHILRDWRRDEVLPIDRKLFPMMEAIAARLGRQPRFAIVSGYRSPATNAMLRQNSGGVAKKSLHMVGQAIDLRLEGVDLARLRQAALELSAGGVGYYPGSGFVHIDTGRVRSWSG